MIKNYKMYVIQLIKSLCYIKVRLLKLFYDVTWRVRDLRELSLRFKH